MFHLTALVTCLAILAYFLISFRVAKARETYGIKAPAVSGNPDFERIYRVQMNTLEWMPVFLPALWLFAIYVSDAIAAALGVVWIIGRILYMIATPRPPTNADRALRSREVPPSFSGWARPGPSCGA